jgi:hypothetical protein
MDWSAVGALGELAGAAGVIASLVYLARQIRQNARSQNQAAADEAVRALVDWLHPLLQNPEAWDLFWRGCTDLDALTEGERARWIPMALVWLKTVEAVFLKAESGSLEAEVWDGWSKILRSFNGHSGLTTYFDARRFAFTSAFNMWMDAEAEAMAEQPNMEQLAHALASDQ